MPASTRPTPPPPALHEVRPLSCFARGPSGVMVGGAVVIEGFAPGVSKYLMLREIDAAPPQASKPASRAGKAAARKS